MSHINQSKGLERLIKATGYSWNGLKATWRYEQAFRQEVWLTLLLLPIALWVGHGAVEYVLLIGSLLLVWVVELLNSAVEAAIDRMGEEHHELSGRAKDLGSAAVLIALAIAGLTWGVILIG